jgi:hypothetical protein
MLADGSMPDFRIIAAFKRCRLKGRKGFFLEVQALSKSKTRKLGPIVLDGIKVKANASKHKAANYEGMKRKADELKKKIEDLVGIAEQANYAEEGKSALTHSPEMSVADRMPSSGSIVCGPESHSYVRL